MDSRTHQDITAATAVHRELGPDYEEAVAESLVERIGAEVDKRVDARLAQRAAPLASPAPPPTPAPPASPARSGWAPVVLALGSMLVGLLSTLAAVKNESGGNAIPLVLIIWVAIAAINVAAARRR